MKKYLLINCHGAADIKAEFKIIEKGRNLTFLCEDGKKFYNDQLIKILNCYQIHQNNFDIELLPIFTHIKAKSYLEFLEDFENLETIQSRIIVSLISKISDIKVSRSITIVIYITLEIRNEESGVYNNT